MRRILAKILLLFMMMALLFSVKHKAAAAEGKTMDVKIKIGYDDNYKVGFSTPVTLDIKNYGENFNGEVEIRVPSTPGKYISYVKSLSLEKEAEKTVTMNVPVTGYRVKYKVLVTKEKETIFEDSISFDMTSNNITQFIGILSEDFDSLTYINKMPVQQGMTVNTKTIGLTEKNFPEDLFAIKAFDLLVINNFDTSKLSSSQYNTLKAWVRDGGTLLLGTGNNYQKTLGVFKDDFIKGKPIDVKNISTTKIYELGTNGDNKKAANVEVLNLTLNDGVTVLEDANTKLVQVLNIGKGHIGVTAFDLGQAPFAGWSNNTAFSEKLITMIGIKDISFNGEKYMGREPYMISEVLNQFSEMGNVKTSQYYIILFIYILVVAPLSYFILFKLDKRELMWITVPVTAILFGVIIFISGLGTRLNKVTTNIVSLYNLDKEGNATATTYAGIFSTKKSKMKIEGKNGELILPIPEQNYMDPNRVITNEDLEAKIYVDGTNGLEFINTSILQTKMVEIQGNTINIGKIEANLAMKNGDITGEVKNNTNLDLEDCYIVTPSEYYKLDGLKAGETKALSKKDGTYGGNIQEFAQKALFNQGQMYNPTMGAAANKQFMENMQKSNMINLMLNNGMLKIDGITMIAFSKSPSATQLLVNKGEPAVHHRSLLMMPVEFKFNTGDFVEYPKGFIPYNVLQNGNLKYDPYGGRLYGYGAVEIIYNIPKDIKVEELYIDTAISNYGGNTPVISLFNVKNNTFEEVKNETIKSTDIDKYLSSDNKVKVKIDLKDTDVSVPKLGAKGKVQ